MADHVGCCVIRWEPHDVPFLAIAAKVDAWAAGSLPTPVPAPEQKSKCGAAGGASNGGSCHVSPAESSVTGW